MQGGDVDRLESKIIEQESEINNMENRNYFSLHCVHMETQLVHANVEVLSNLVHTMVSVQIRGHTEVTINGIVRTFKLLPNVLLFV